MSARRRNGFTLIETMVVIAIIGIMAALAGVEVIATLRSTRVTAMAKSLQGVLLSARTRAIVTRCPHFVQINGPQYGGTGPVGFETKKNVASIYRKGGCNTAVPGFAAGDVRVDTTPLAVDGLTGELQLGVDTNIIADGLIDSESLVVNFQASGDRQLAVDSSGGGPGSFAAASPSSDTILMPHRTGATVNDGLAYRSILIPSTNGVPRIQQ